MKKACLAMFVAAIVLGMVAPHALATQVFKKKFEAKYVKTSGNKEFVAAATKAKCNICHFGKTKKNRNDYGKALSKLLDKNNYKTSRVKAEPDKVDKELEAAFKKVEAQKASGGDTFGALLKSGKLPGTAPKS